MEQVSQFLPLGGSRRAYYDTFRRQVISRRQYLKRHGIFPRSTGAASTVRSDKGCPHRVVHRSSPRPQPFVKTVKLPLGIAAEIHPRSAFQYDIVIQNVRVVPLNLEQRGKRRRWHCGMGGCPNQYDDTYKMALHCYEAHYLDACQLAGVGPCTILPVHEIHARERRARMPWRYEALEIG